LLRRTQATGEAPDRRYWTEYDHFMLEREARARRREYVYGLIARGWRRLATRVARGRTGRAGVSRAESAANLISAGPQREATAAPH